MYAVIPPARRNPAGIPAAVSRPSSPSRMYEISPRVNPSTRRLASSRLRSDRAIRALLYTTPKATLAARSVMTKVNRRSVPPMVS